MNTKYTIFFRVLSVLCVIAAYVCYRSLGTSTEIPIQWSWPIHILIMMVAGAAVISFIGARNKAINMIISSTLLPPNKRWIGKITIETAAMAFMLVLVFPPLIIVNNSVANLQSMEGLNMFYSAWLGFSVLAATYFILLQPVISVLLSKYAS